MLGRARRDSFGSISRLRFATLKNTFEHRSISSILPKAHIFLTPRNPGLTPNPPDLILSTPQSSQALHQASRELQTIETLSRVARTLIRKADKHLSEADARAALSEFEKQQAQHQLDSSQTTRSRRRIQVNPNECFIDAEAIRDAVDRATTLSAQVASRNVEIEAWRDVSGSAGTTFESMCNQGQI
ncbi:hypothetical protein K3495_g14442 [Podosphaera aphanis]|nr:hypothetical protein K3495_g14442 [Podosphaera aphanis]